MNTLCKLMMVILISCSVAVTQAQDEQKFILVVEKATESGYEYIYYFSDGEVQTFVPSPSACYDIDNSGIHIAYISPDEMTLIVKRIDNDQTILQIEWQSDWEMCSFVWNDSQTLAIYSISSEIYQAYDISDGTLHPTVITSNVWPANLPDRTPQDNVGIYIPSSTERYYLYETCAGPQCKALGDYWIYDTVLQTNVVELTRGYLSTPNQSTPGLPYYGPEASWSYDDRYIAYRFMTDTVYENFDLELYDLTLQEVKPILQDGYGLPWDVDYKNGINWSPSSHRLLYWSYGRIPEPMDGDEPGLYTSIIYDVDQDKVIVGHEPLYLDSGVTWKPDGTAVVIIDKNDNLIQIDTLTGAVQTIDTNVSDVIAWREPDTFTYGLP